MSLAPSRGWKDAPADPGDSGSASSPDMSLLGGCWLQGNHLKNDFRWIMIFFRGIDKIGTSMKIPPQNTYLWYVWYVCFWHQSAFFRWGIPQISCRISCGPVPITDHRMGWSSVRFLGRWRLLPQDRRLRRRRNWGKVPGSIFLGQFHHDLTVLPHWNYG